MKNKYTLLAIIILFLAGFFYYKNSNLKNSLTTPTSNVAVAESKINLVIDFGNGDIKNFDLTANSEDTAFSILKTATEKENINLQVKQYDFGVFVEKIGESESTAEKSWIYYVNGESGQIAADQQKLKNGDKIEWKYEIPK